MCLMRSEKSKKILEFLSQLRQFDTGLKQRLFVQKVKKHTCKSKHKSAVAFPEQYSFTTFKHGKKRLNYAIVLRWSAFDIFAFRSHFYYPILLYHIFVIIAMVGSIPAFLAERIAQPIYHHCVRCTSHFWVKDSCIGCGLCSKKCPIHAIEMQHQKPVWVKDKCVMCFGCLHRCPKFAIQYGRNTEKHGQYTNPNVKV